MTTVTSVWTWRDRTAASAPRLIAASTLMLFVELGLIRWSGTYLLYLSYFSNLILLASFLGIGLGFLRASRDGTRDLGAWAPALLGVLIGFLVLFPTKIEQSSNGLIFFAADSKPTGLPIWAALPIVFVIVTGVMVAFGEIAGREFRRFGPLEAYRWDILGSIAGSLLLAVIAVFRAPSWVWAVLVLVGTVAVMGRRLTGTVVRAILNAAGALAVLVLLVMQALAPGVSWSPYYMVTTTPIGDGWNDIRVNGIPHQAFGDVEQRLTWEPGYAAPYTMLPNNPLREVLIVGAGSGTDVALALLKGAQHIDAVEIDPRIQQIGKEMNPNHPYDDPRVTVHINDGRAFLSSTDKKYDLILFALPDSLTLVSGSSQLRLESYLFTAESLQKVREHLTDEGGFAMYNFYRQDWLVQRLSRTVAEAFGHTPCVTDIQKQGFASIGAAVQTGNQVCPPGRPELTDVAAAPAPVNDDRPFLYLRDVTIPTNYLVVLSLVLVFAALAIWLTVRDRSGSAGAAREAWKSRDLFFMGAAFLLMETKSITSFALLFGTTWLVNAIAFGGILIMVLLAIETTRRFPRIPEPAIIVALFGSLAVAFVIPNSALLPLALPLRIVCAVLLAFAPIFFANLLFTNRFKDTPRPALAFGINLFGAMLGGCLEYLSLVTGYRMLLVLAAVLYLLALPNPRRAGWALMAQPVAGT